MEFAQRIRIGEKRGSANAILFGNEKDELKSDVHAYNSDLTNATLFNRAKGGDAEYVLLGGHDFGVRRKALQERLSEEELLDQMDDHLMADASSAQGIHESLKKIHEKISNGMHLYDAANLIAAVMHKRELQKGGYANKRAAQKALASGALLADKINELNEGKREHTQTVENVLNEIAGERGGKAELAELMGLNSEARRSLGLEEPAAVVAVKPAPPEPVKKKTKAKPKAPAPSEAPPKTEPVEPKAAEPKEEPVKEEPPAPPKLSAVQEKTLEKAVRDAGKGIERGGALSAEAGPDGKPPKREPPEPEVTRLPDGEKPIALPDSLTKIGMSSTELESKPLFSKLLSDPKTVFTNLRALVAGSHPDLKAVNSQTLELNKLGSEFWSNYYWERGEEHDGEVRKFLKHLHLTGAGEDEIRTHAGTFAEFIGAGGLNLTEEQVGDLLVNAVENYDKIRSGNTAELQEAFKKLGFPERVGLAGSTDLLSNRIRDHGKTGLKGKITELKNQFEDRDALATAARRAFGMGSPQHGRALPLKEEYWHLIEDAEKPGRGREEAGDNNKPGLFGRLFGKS